MTALPQYPTASIGQEAASVAITTLDASGNIEIVSQINPMPMIDAYSAPVTTNWTSGTALNTAITLNTAGMDTVALTIIPAAGITGGVITFNVYDGANWFPIKCARQSSYATDSAFSLAGSPGQQSWTIPAAGFPEVQVILTSAITGTGNVTIAAITSSAPDTSVVTCGLDPYQGTSYYFNGAQLAAASTVKASSGTLFGLSIYNPNASVEYLQVFDAASVTVGTTAPVQSFAILASGQLNMSFNSTGIAFTNSIKIAATTTATGSTAPGTGLVVNAQYK